MRTSAIQCNSLSEIRDVIIQPLETYPVYVTYSPVSAELNSGKVVIKPYDTAYKFSVRREFSKRSRKQYEIKNFRESSVVCDYISEERDLMCRKPMGYLSTIYRVPITNMYMYLYLMIMIMTGLPCRSPCQAMEEWVSWS